MKIQTTLLALALASGYAHAGQQTSLHEQLTQEQGMQQVADGLYALTTEDGEAFVAINKAGQAALAVRVEALRGEFAARMQKDGLSRAESNLLSGLGRSAQKLRESASAKVEVSNGGTCGNGNTLYTRAYSTGGYTASAYAVNALDFSPPTPTLNEATAYNDFASNYVSTSALTPAQTAVNNYGSCIAVAEATVSCPGNPYPQSVSMAYSNSRSRLCFQ